MDLGHSTNVYKASKEDESQWCSVVFQKDTDWVSEETAGSEFTADIGHHKQQQRCDNGEVESAVAAKTLQNLNAFLEIDEGYVEAKDVAGEPCYPAEPVARICDGKDPVQNQRPSRDRVKKDGLLVFS